MGSNPQLYDNMSQTPTQATGHSLGHPTWLREKPQWLTGSDWTSQTSWEALQGTQKKGQVNFPRLGHLSRSLKTSRIWDKVLGPSPAHTLSPESWEGSSRRSQEKIQADLEGQFDHVIHGNLSFSQTSGMWSSPGRESDLLP